MSSEDNQLTKMLDLIAKGDQAALSELYNIVSARLLGIQLRILKDRALAEEALQETFVKVWKSAANFNAEKASPQVWLNSLARNQALDDLRKIRTRAPISVRDPHIDPDQWASQVRATEDQVTDGQSLSVCLDRIDKEARQCIVGVYCEGYTHDELSTMLKRPLGTVKSWIRRGLQSLRECLNELT